MHLSHSIALAGILMFALLSNIPLGYLRQGSPKYSLRWFVYIHLSIPFIVILRVVNGISWHYIPLTFVLAVAGQFVGGRLHRRKHS